MKKVLLIIFMMFLFIGTTQAAEIETQLEELKNEIKNLKSEVSNLKTNRLDKTYPIGSIFETTTYSSAQEVSNALGGTWEVYGSGKTLVGVDHNDSDFNAVNKTGGGKNTTLTVANLPSHTHSIPALSGTAAEAGAHTHTIPALSGTTNTTGSHTHQSWTALNPITTVSSGISGISSAGYKYLYSGDQAHNIWIVESAGSHSHTVTTTASNTGSNGAHTHSVSTTASNTGAQGSGTAFTNLQPYITVYMYKRVS
ncbi:MAG: hypothetical protein HFH46_02175 [Bacilli bacterium]|nr:hypothetical protein [Bacilli bacterium]